MVSAIALLVGIAREDAGEVAVSFAAAAAALVLLWAGVARTSGPSQRHRHG